MTLFTALASYIILYTRTYNYARENYKKNNMHKMRKICIKIQYCHEYIVFFKKLDVYPVKKQYNDSVACKFVPLKTGQQIKNKF